MFIKPEHKTKQPKTMKAYTVESKTINPNEYIPKIDPSKLSLDYLLENEVITILSSDYVIKHGALWDDAGLDWDGIGYYTVDRDEVRFTGLAYEVYDHKDMKYYPFFNTNFQDGTLLGYTYYVDGLMEGPDVEFYPSGKVKSYCVNSKSVTIGIYYEWYENGMIKQIKDYSISHGFRYTEFDKQGNIIKQGKV